MPRPEGTIYIRPRDLKALSQKEARRLTRALEVVLFYPKNHPTKSYGRREKFGGSGMYGTEVPGLENNLTELYYDLCELNSSSEGS